VSEYVLIDTDVCSVLMRGGERAGSLRGWPAGAVPCLSFQTVAELWQWAEVRNWGKRRRAELDRWLRRFAVVPYDAELCRIWGQIRAHRRRIGRPLAAEDAWIAACAIRHGIPLLTLNRRDFEDIPDLEILTGDEP